MDYRKEKNLLIAFDGEVIKARYDWSTGICYGNRGTQLKGISPAFRGSTYDRMITSHKWISANLHGDELALALDRWERLASVGLYTSDHDLLFDETYNFPNLKKDFVQYLKNNAYSELTRYHQKLYIYSQMQEYQMLDGEYRREIDQIVNSNWTHMPIEWAIKGLLRLQLEDFQYMPRYYGSAISTLDDYYEMCTEMGQENPVITKNFFITICKAHHMYDIWEKQHINENLKQHNDLKELYYENDTYLMYPLITTEQFHEEALAQGNCVERLYMERVADGRTHVVVIRRKDAPEKSLVTCEIKNNWHIQQYLAKFNHTPAAPEMDFMKELKSYLKSLSQN